MRFLAGASPSPVRRGPRLVTGVFIKCMVLWKASVTKVALSLRLDLMRKRTWRRIRSVTGWEDIEFEKNADNPKMLWEIVNDELSARVFASTGVVESHYCVALPSLTALKPSVHQLGYF